MCVDLRKQNPPATEKSLTFKSSAQKFESHSCSFYRRTILKDFCTDYIQMKSFYQEIGCVPEGRRQMLGIENAKICVTSAL